MPAVQGKSWCFTINNWTNVHQTSLRALLSDQAQVEYGIFGREVAATGTPHLQGYVRFRSNKRIRTVQRLLPGAHVSIARGTAQQNRDYCSKDSDFDEFGTLPVSQQGRRRDLEEFIAWGEAFQEEHGRPPSSPEVARERPREYLLHPRSVRLFQRRATEPELRTGTPNEWQSELEQELDDPADDRKIVFYVDEEGGTGKTWFQQYYLTKYPGRAQVLSIGKKQDLAHMVLTHTRVFFFNVPRTQMEFLSYSLLEDLKDRMIFSPKYDSQMKKLHCVPHVIVFSNEAPDETKLSQDRYDIRST